MLDHDLIRDDGVSGSRVTPIIAELCDCATPSLSANRGGTGQDNSLTRALTFDLAGKLIASFFNVGLRESAL